MDVEGGELQAETQESPYDKELPPTAARSWSRKCKMRYKMTENSSLLLPFLPLAQYNEVVFQS
jgi:hypothetical protein